MKQQKEYDVTLYCDGMEYGELTTLTIEAQTGKKAIKWVEDNMRYEAIEV